MRVLVVEDHKRLAEAVAAGLRDEGMAVDVAFDGQNALDHVALARYDVIVLDRDLPGLHGDEVCKTLAADRCPARRFAFRAGRRLALTPKEFAVLECLLAAQGALVSAEELLERVWDENADLFTTTVKTTVGRLRAKLGDPPVIATVRDGGYRIEGT